MQQRVSRVRSKRTRIEVVHAYSVLNINPHAAATIQHIPSFSEGQCCDENAFHRSVLSERAVFP